MADKSKTFASLKKRLALILTAVLFIVITILLDISAKADSIWSVLYSFASFTRLCYIFLIVVAATGIVAEVIDERQRVIKQRLARAEVKEKEKLANEEKQKAAIAPEAVQEENPDVKKYATVEEETQRIIKYITADSKSKAANATSSKTDANKAKKPLFEDDGAFYKTILAVIYALSLVVLLIISIVNIRNAMPTSGYAYNSKIGILQIILLFIGLSGSFVLHKWISTKDNDEEKHLLLGFLVISEVLLLVTLAFVLLFFIFKLNYLHYLNWVYFAVQIYVLAAVLFGVCKTVIKRSFVSDFDYTLVYIGSANGGDGIFDIIEKNTGLSFKSMWSIRYLGKLLPSIVLAVTLTIFLATSVYKVESYQSAVVYRFGEMHQANVSSGLHLKLPYPIDKVEIYDTTRMSAVQIGYVSSSGNDFLWTEAHDGGEYKLVLNNGIELVSINMQLVYYIDDLAMYLTNYSAPESVLAARAYEILMEQTADTTLDAILCEDRESMSNNIKAELAAYAENMQLGLNVSDVIIESIHPPVEVAKVYQSAVSAVSEKKTLITEAETYADEKIIAAEGERESVVYNAQQNQYETLAQTNSNLSVYYAAFAAYEESPESFVLSKYLETYSVVLSESGKVYLFSPNIGDDLSDYLINGSTTGVVGAVISGREG